ncbi:MAG TPA: DUF711 family protein [Bryobacteraceae bacterium]|jgi:hypothetical protein
MRKLVLLLAFAALACAAGRPRVRAVTAFIQVDSKNPTASIQDAQKFLASAKDALNKAGFEGGGGRITTQAFPLYTKGMTRQDAVAMLHKLGEAASNGRTSLCIGPAMARDSDDTAPVDVLIDILSEGSVNGNVVIADEQGIHWRAIPQAARIIKTLSMRSDHGNANVNFGAMALIKPYGPYYPSSYYLGEGHAFTLAMEGANVVADVFSHNHDPREAEQQLTSEFAQYTRELEGVANQIARSTGWRYEGIDATPAPQGQNSIGGAIESFSGEPFGSSGSITASGILARALLATPIKRAGTSGPMLPVMEDPVLASRWGEGTYSLTSLLAYSAVGANGLETVPLPGDVTQEQIEHILRDVATVAFKDKTPLSARLLPSPGRHAGEKSDFTVSYLINTILQPLPGVKP